MGFATGNVTLTPGAHPEAPHQENGLPNNQSLPQNENQALLADHSTQSGEYLTHLARATNDAVRDWDVTTGQLSWPQGLKSLLGYDQSSPEIGFWDERIHPSDRTRVVASLR